VTRTQLALLTICFSIWTAAFGQPLAGQESAPKDVTFRVKLPQSDSGVVRGRLLLFLKQGSGDDKVDAEEFRPTDTWVTGKEVRSLPAGSTVEVNANETAFPKPFGELPPGDYEVQAVLDVNHSYNYGGREAADWISKVAALTNWTAGSGKEPTLVLDGHPEERSHHTDADAKVARLEQFTSPALTRFWGHEMQIKAWVILPPNYETSAQTRFPVVYWTHGFGGNIDYALIEGMRLHKRMAEKKMPPMIWVMLDESIPQGTHEFADSVNNGPWGTALTTEFLPYLERKYRMDARPSGRLLTGHSSGGWATLQLQVNYPRIFGGTWSTSPDPSDFHDFTGADLYAPNANMYRKPDGSPNPLIRSHGKVMATFEQFARLETVLGPYGGQIASFDWVFSPKGDDGAPKQMFDRQTGAIHPDVVEYWRDHYDLAYVTKTNWASKRPYLRGKIHLIVGTADTFYLDGAAHKFEAVLKSLNADPHFSYLPEKTHMDLFVVGSDREALYDQITKEMYAVARPKPQARPATRVEKSAALLKTSGH
jgi:hypothetical protein